MEGISRREKWNEPHEFCGRKALKHPMFVVGVERKHVQAAMCSTG
jgi:hypothetical protein